MDELNQYIEDYITYLERIELDMVQSGRPFSLKYLRERGDFESVSSSFVSFMKNEINHSNLRLSTLKNHLSTLQVLCQYQPQVSFDDLTFNFLCAVGLQQQWQVFFTGIAVLLAVLLDIYKTSKDGRTKC